MYGHRSNLILVALVHFFTGVWAVQMSMGVPQSAGLQRPAPVNQQAAGKPNVQANPNTKKMTNASVGSKQQRDSALSKPQQPIKKLSNKPEKPAPLTEEETDELVKVSDKKRGDAKRRAKMADRQHDKKETQKEDKVEKPKKKGRGGKGQRLYGPTKWDPLLENAGTELKVLYEAEFGHLKDHNLKPGDNEHFFGDLNIISWNIYSKIKDQVEKKNTIRTIESILDHAHPTLLALLGVRKQELDEIRQLLSTQHYAIAADDRFALDNRSSSNLYFPILYDTKMLNLVATNYFEYKHTVYASTATFDVKGKELNKRFVVINLDASFASPTFGTDIGGLLQNSIRDFENNFLGSLPRANRTDEYKKTQYMFLVGEISPNNGLMTILKKSNFVNTLDADKLNNKLTKSTLHNNKGGARENLQSNFILQRFGEGIIATAYARILNNKFSIGTRFPVQAILAFKQ